MTKLFRSLVLAFVAAISFATFASPVEPVFVESPLETGFRDALKSATHGEYVVAYRTLASARALAKDQEPSEAFQELVKLTATLGAEMALPQIRRLFSFGDTSEANDLIKSQLSVLVSEDAPIPDAIVRIVQKIRFGTQEMPFFFFSLPWEKPTDI